MKNNKLYIVLSLVVIALLVVAAGIYNVKEDAEFDPEKAISEGRFELSGDSVDFNDPSAKNARVVIGDPRFNEGYIFETLYFHDEETDEVIDVSSENAYFFVKFPSGEAFLHPPMIDAEYYKFSIQPPLSVGRYEYIIKPKEDERTYKATHTFSGVETATAQAVESLEDSTLFSIENIDLSDLQAGYYIHPHADGGQLPMEGELLQLPQDAEDSEHQFFLKYNDVWYESVIDKSDIL